MQVTKITLYFVFNNQAQIITIKNKNIMYSIYVDDSLVSFADIRTEKQFFIKAIHNAILDQHWGSTIKVQLDGEIVREYTCEHLSKEDQKKYLNELIVNSAIEGGITIEQATLILLSYAL